MYALLGIDVLIRILLAMILIFVAIPALALRRPRTSTRLEWFWWNLGVGITLLTLLGQVLTLVNAASILTYGIAMLLLIVFGSARKQGVTPSALIAARYRGAVISGLHVLEGRVNARRRLRRFIRRQRTALNRLFAAGRTRWVAAGWALIIAAAALPRFYRAFATANLGFSDTYVHLYLMRLLDQGRQVDPAWGPYPRGMHFLLLAIERLTNVDVILLMNFFGPLVGVLMTVAVADAARRLSGSFSAALVAGLIFATMIGGPKQYFVMGGSFETDKPSFARSLLSLSYEQVPSSGEFDVLFTVFQRQTSTLPQELAIVLLFPAALFLLDWFRSRERWRLVGFIGCTAAITAVHSGVVIPLLVLSLAVVVGAAAERPLDLPAFRRAAVAGVVGIMIGASWMLGFIAYPHAGGGKTVSTGSNVGSTALYYFPFLRPLAGESDPAAALMRDKTYTDLTPFLIACVLLALLVPFLAWSDRAARRGSILFISTSVLLFFLSHGATVLRVPALVEVRRNATWFAMAATILIGLASVTLSNLLERWGARGDRSLLRWGTAIPVLVLVLWGSRVPSVAAPTLRQKILDYSGYGATAYAVVRITREIEPFTWTLVTYGQEYPMVLGRGFHIPAVEFLERYDPGEPVLRIPTPHVFVVVEKTPHRFQINTWAARFSRKEVERRLQTWCYLYQLSHDDMRLFLDSEQVSVYEIKRSAEEINRMMQAAKRD